MRFHKDFGQLYGTFTGVNFSIALAPVPEPAGLGALLGVAALGWGIIRGRRRAAAAIRSGSERTAIAFSLNL
jgi:hypothetical protein